MRWSHRIDGVWMAVGLVVGGCTLLVGIDEDYHLVCTPGELQCSDNTPQKCVDGVWKSEAPCMAQTCISGTCKGACEPEDKRCDGKMPQSCSAEGFWKDEPACDETTPYCLTGECYDTPPSCQGLPSTCGPNGDESCCATTVVAGGTYDRGNNAMFPAAVSGFHLERFEITVGRFRAFVNAYPTSKPMAGAGAHPLILGSGWDMTWDEYLPADQTALKDAVKCNPFQTWTDDEGSNENLPMNCISWYVAFAFCAWDGGRLPTEAEWNYAAAGGSLQREYPWSMPSSSTTIDGTYAVYECTGDGSAVGDCAFSDFQAVGSRSPKGDAWWGQADLAGNLWEWTLDSHDVSYQCPQLPPGCCTDCANLQAVPERVIRGGSTGSDAMDLLSSARAGFNAMGRYADVGARCVTIP